MSNLAYLSLLQIRAAFLGVSPTHASIPENAHGACVLAFCAGACALFCPDFWTQLPGQPWPFPENQAHSLQPEFAPNPFLLISRSAPAPILNAERNCEQKLA